jgi:hypothetical protein
MHMKHILPILTLTTLAAAASAQAAAPAGLSYNRVGFSRASKSNSISAQTLVGGSNVLVGIESHNGENNSEPQLTLGYVFKNVYAGVDATVFGTQAQWEKTVYGVTLRRSLSEVVAGLEGSVSYANTFSSGQTATFGIGGATTYAEGAWAYELAYNVNKQVQVAVGYVHFVKAGNANDDNQTVVSLRYNF